MNEPVFLRDFQFDTIHPLYYPVSHSLNCGNKKVNSYQIRELVKEYFRPHRMYGTSCLFEFPSFWYVCLALSWWYTTFSQWFRPNVNSTTDTPQRIDITFNSFNRLTTFSMDWLFAFWATFKISDRTQHTYWGLSPYRKHLTNFQEKMVGVVMKELTIRCV